MCGSASVSPVTVRQGLNHSLPEVSVPGPCLVPVRDHQRLVHGEQPRQLGLVRLELLPRRPDGGVLVRRVLKLDHAQRQPVHKQNHVRPARVPVLRNGELVDCQPVVVGRLAEVDDTNDVPAHRSPGFPVLDLHAVHDHPMKSPVPRLHRRPLRPRQLPICIVQRIDRQVGIQSGEDVPQPPPQHHLPVLVALSAGGVGGDVRPVRHLPAEGGEPIKGRLLDVGFGYGCQGSLPDSNP